MKGLSDSHPIVAAAYFVALLIVAMFVWNPVVQLLAMVGGIFYCLSLHGAGKTLRDLGFFLPFFLLIALTNPLFSSQSGTTVLCRLWRLEITLEALLYGIGLALMVVGVMLWCKCMTAVLTEDKLLCLFGRVVPKLALILSMSLRLIPLFLRRFRQVSAAQRAAGMTAGKAGWLARVKTMGRVLTATLAWSMEHAMETASSMKARGYGLSGRSSFSVFRFDRRDALLLTLILLLLALCIGGVALGQVEYDYYPTLGVLGTDPFELTAYCAFGILAFLPFSLQVKEAILWRYCRSKI
ncbi:MAG: energy-coupling factor transporter transmembrane protein EcfT [Clostridia bacterium]|nr:energy-coupling factor transporter transmembrane protein EcfT [Clostridia bacterium]